MKYTKNEIFEILKADYKNQSETDFMVSEDHHFYLDMPLIDWIDLCDLLPIMHLRSVFNEWFEINISKEEWRKSLVPVSEKTLNDLCEIISENADRLKLLPIVIFGEKCYLAGFYRLLSRKNKNIYPSIKFTDKNMEDGFELFRVCQLLNPGHEIKFEFKISKRFNRIVWGGIFILLLSSIITSLFNILISFALLMLLFLHIFILNRP